MCRSSWPPRRRPRHRELKRRLSVALSFALLFGGGPAAAAQDVDVATVVEGLEFPTGIAFSPDGDLMYVNERAGRIRVVDGDGLRPEPLATVATTTAGETGLLGIAASPDGTSLYVFATDPGGSSNRILRVAAEGGNGEVIVDGLPASVYHNGGGVAFDDDGALLVSNGEIHESTNAQDPGALGGKVYRFTSDGDAAENPFGDAIALGLRNPYGMTVDPVTGDAFVTENGPSSDDEVNRIQVGGNYGWPDVLGAAGDARPSGPGEYHDPITVQEDIVVPTGIAFADPEETVQGFEGDLFYGTYGEQAIHRVELNESRDEAISDEIFIQEDEPVIALEWGPRGLYYSTPTAIKVVALAEPDGRPGSDEGTPGSDAASPVAPQPRDEPSWPLIGIGAAIVAVAAAAVVFARR